MQPWQEAELLRVFVGESDKHHGRPLYEAIVDAARQSGLAGATVVRGLLSYGVHGQVHSAKVLHLSEALPMIVEIIDQPDRIAAFLPELDQIMTEGLVTLEKIRSITYHANDKPTH